MTRRRAKPSRPDLEVIRQAVEQLEALLAAADAGYFASQEPTDGSQRRMLEGLLEGWRSVLRRSDDTDSAGEEA